MTKLLNIHNFHSNKTNRDYSVIQVLRDLNTREISNGYIGAQISEEIFMPDSLVGILSSSDIGKEITLQYEVYNGKAVLNNVVVNK